MMRWKGIIVLFSVAYVHSVFLGTDARRVGVPNAEQLFVLHLRTSLSVFAFCPQ